MLISSRRVNLSLIFAGRFFSRWCPGSGCLSHYQDYWGHLSVSLPAHQSHFTHLFSQVFRPRFAQGFLTCGVILRINLYASLPVSFPPSCELFPCLINLHLWFKLRCFALVPVGGSPSTFRIRAPASLPSDKQHAALLDLARLVSVVKLDRTKLSGATSNTYQQYLSGAQRLRPTTA